MSLNFLLTSTFFGFACFSLIYIIIQSIKVKSRIFSVELDKIAVILVILASIISLIFYLSEIIEIIVADDAQQTYAWTNRATGPYWWAYWMPVFTNLILVQLLWFPSMKKSKPYRLFLAALLLIITEMERLIILITSYHRDYLPSHWAIQTNFIGNYFILILIKLAFFSLFMFATSLLLKKVK